MDSTIRHVPKGWEEKKIKQCFKFKNGKGFSGELREKADSDYCYPVYGGNGIIGYCNIPLLDKPTIIVGRVGEYCGNVFKTQEKSWVTDNAMLVSEVLLKDFDINFWTVMLNSLHFNHFSDSTGQPKITQGGIGAITVVYPISATEQTAIANILSKADEAITSVQDSITAAERLKKSLMQNLLTGKMKPDGTFRTPEEFYIDEKFGKVPVGWEVKKLGEIVEFLDNLRKPVKSGERDKMKGEYPYYGAAGIVDYINDYLFDGTFILFGEDGENLLSRKLPQAFIVKGKFWVNNHAHILKINDGFDIELLVRILESKKYDNIVYGSAQPKINKSDLSKIKLIIPISLDEQKKITELIAIIDEVIKGENKRCSLERLKKSLMQNLFTGKYKLNAYK